MSTLWSVCTYIHYDTKSCYSRYNPAVESSTNTPPQWSACDALPGFPPHPGINRRGVTIQLSLSPYHQSLWSQLPQSTISLSKIPFIKLFPELDHVQFFVCYYGVQKRNQKRNHFCHFCPLPDSDLKF